MDTVSRIAEFRRYPAGDVTQLIRSLGVTYEEKPLAPGQSGFIEYSDGAYRIVVNSNESRRRQRFTAAHELAHYLLHGDLLDDRGKLNRHVDILFGEGAATNPPEPFAPFHEVQANRYAADLLMPDELVRQKFAELRDIQRVADLFDVSRRAMEIRLETIGLIGGSSGT